METAQAPLGSQRKTPMQGLIPGAPQQSAFCCHVNPRRDNIVGSHIARKRSADGIVPETPVEKVCATFCGALPASPLSRQASCGHLLLIKAAIPVLLSKASIQN
jgi:hypothetical protein